MNKIRQVRELNKRELENNVSPSASWHTDYRDTASIYIGGLPFECSEGDVVTIFSQYGEPTYINLVRDKETGKSRGFAFLKYEDQRSCDLAVDNLGGAVIEGTFEGKRFSRTLQVDHTRYKVKEGDEDQGTYLDEGVAGEETGSESDEEQRPKLQEQIELEKLIREHDEDDPMKEFLVQEKKDELAQALAKLGNGKSLKLKERKERRRHYHRSRRENDGKREKDKESRRSHRERRRSRSRDEYRRVKSERDSEEREQSPRRRSPRRDSRDRYREERDRDGKQSRRRRDDEIDENPHRSRRYS